MNRTLPIAFYQPPSPPALDIAHTYVFYLFEQEDGFAPPPAGNPFSEALVNEANNRVSFNLNHLAGEKGVGPLVGATYFLAQNDSGTASASGSANVNLSSPTAVPFLGGTSQRAFGFAGPVLTAVAIAFALIWAA